jgi:hypothetical protein
VRIGNDRVALLLDWSNSRQLAGNRPSPSESAA